MVSSNEVVLEEIYRNEIEVAMNQWKVDVIGTRHLNKDYRAKKKILEGEAIEKKESLFKNPFRKAFIYSKKDFMKGIKLGGRAVTGIQEGIKDMFVLEESEKSNEDASKQLPKRPPSHTVTEEDEMVGEGMDKGDTTAVNNQHRINEAIIKEIKEQAPQETTGRPQVSTISPTEMPSPMPPSPSIQIE